MQTQTGNLSGLLSVCFSTHNVLLCSLSLNLTGMKGPTWRQLGALPRPPSGPTMVLARQGCRGNSGPDTDGGAAPASVISYNKSANCQRQAGGVREARRVPDREPKDPGTSTITPGHEHPPWDVFLILLSTPHVSEAASVHVSALVFSRCTVWDELSRLLLV